MEDDYARKRAVAFVDALDRLWGETDHPEWKEMSLYSHEELMQILGEWEHVRKALDAFAVRIKASYPGIPGWDPIQGQRPLEG